MTNITFSEEEWSRITPELQSKGWNYSYKAAVYATS